MIQLSGPTGASKSTARNCMNQPPRSRKVRPPCGRAAWLALVLLVTGCSSSSNSPRQLVNEGRYDEAIEVTTQAIRVDPDDANAYLYRGRAYHCRNSSGDIERAIADFTESIRLAPQESEAYYSRALAYRDSGDAEKSAADDKSARDLDKRLQEVYAQLPVPPTPPVATEETKEPESSKEETTVEAPAATEPLVGRGMRGIGEPRRERPDKPSSSGDIESASPDLGGRTGGSGLGSLRRPPTAPQPSPGSRARPSDATWEDSLLADDPLGQDLRSPPVRPGSSAREPVDERSRGRGRSAVDGATDSQRAVAAPFRRPLQSPFPQRAPRPTGFVEEAPQAPVRPQRQATAPYSVPTVHPPGAYQFDYNP